MRSCRRSLDGNALCMISEPVPMFHMMGSKSALMAATVIIFGRTRSTAPHNGVVKVAARPMHIRDDG
jgi:succinyl-CoA synthetase alpha subunit